MNREEIIQKFHNLVELTQGDLCISAAQYQAELVDEFTESFRLLEVYRQFFKQIQEICNTEPKHQQLVHRYYKIKEKVKELSLIGVRDQV